MPVLAPAVAALGTYIGAMAASVVVYAAVGAAIGGLSAAVMGGDIGKGMLFGAIGGAVVGGFAGVASSAVSAGTTTAATTSVGMGENVVGAAAATGTKMSAYGTAAASTGSSSGMLGKFLNMSEGAGMATQSLLTVGGPMIAGAFDDSAEIAAAEKEKDRKLSMDLAKLQAETAIKTASMRGGGGSVNDHYAADLQLLNAREQRAQDYKMKQEEYALIEERRQRQAGAVGAIEAAKPVDSTYQGQGILAPKATNPEYAANGAAQPIAAGTQQGVMQAPPTTNEVV